MKMSRDESQSAFPIQGNVLEAKADCPGGVSLPSPKGRAEREQNTRKTKLKEETKKMMKKAITCTLIMILATMSGLQLTEALLNHENGFDYSYWECQHTGFSAYPSYVECYHNIWPTDSGNSEVGLGVTTHYGGQFYFTQAWWDFNAEFGNGDITMIPGLIVDPCVNGNDHHYYNYYGQPQWTYVSGGEWAYWCNYVHYEIYNESLGSGYPVTIDPAASVEGKASAYFYKPSDPPTFPNFGQIWHLDAETGPTTDRPDGLVWSFLHAWEGTP